MPITSRVGLLDALKLTAPAIPSRTGAMPALSGVKITMAGPHEMRFTTTNLDVWLDCTVPFTGPALDEPMLVPHKNLVKMLTAMKGVEITLTRDGDDVTVDDGTTKSKMKGLSPSEYPRQYTPDPANEVTDEITLKDDVLASIAEVLACTSKDQARPILTAVLVSPGAVVATDSYKLAYARHEIDGFTHGAKLDVMVPNWAVKLMPKTGCQMLVHYYKDSAGNATTPRWAEWTDPITGRHALVKLAEGTYPKWEQLVPDVSPSIVVERKAMLDQIKPLLAMSDRSEAPVRFTSTDTGLHLEVLAQDVGNVETTVKTDMRYSEWGTAAFNGKFVEAILKAASTDHATFSLVDVLKPMTITFEDAPVRYLIMPVRVA